MFGYKLVKDSEYWDLKEVESRVIQLQRWLSGFNDLDILWDWALSNENHYSRIDGVRTRYAEKREMNVYGKPLLVSKVEDLKKEIEQAKISVRYALATFRALDKYTFADSDHGLLIAEAVKKLEEIGK